MKKPLHEMTDGEFAEYMRPLRRMIEDIEAARNKRRALGAGLGDTIKKRRKSLKTDEGRVWVADQWLNGESQKDIAKLFNYTKSSQINTAILILIQTYVPEACQEYRPTYDGRRGDWLPWAYGEDRKPLAKLAIERYRQGVRPPERKDVGYGMDQQIAYH